MTSLYYSTVKRYHLIFVCILFSLTSSIVFANAKSYAVMEVVEVEFNSQEQYDNPYLEVDVWIELKNSDLGNEVYRIPIFWDGGNLFRARLVATSPGNWTWKIIDETVKNSDQGFVGQNGSFTAVPADVISNPNNRGFIKVAPNNRTLQYADGTPYFYTADTSWSVLTEVFGFDTANNISGISFKDYILGRKNQGFNGLNVIASFPDDTYTQLWSSKTHGKKTGPNGATPFVVNGEADYKRINPTYWKSVDERMQFLADQGFVTLFETVRRSENWPFRAPDQKEAFYNYVRYLWARYGCYNMIFSWVHHDSQGSIYPNWRELVKDAHDKLSTQLGNQMPYGQPRTAMSFNTSLKNWGSAAPQGIPNAMDIQNVSNAERDETMHEWLSDIYDQRLQPALNLEPFYPGWGLHSSNEINPGLDDTTMAQMQMYGSVLSGGLAGHAWGDAWYAGAAHATGRSQADGGTIVPSNDPQKNALVAFESQAMGHLKSFILDSGHDYSRLVPAADTNLSDSQGFIHSLSISDDREFALGFFTADARTNPSALPKLTNLDASKTYQFEWWNVTDGGWTFAGNITTTASGILQAPALPNNDRTKNWAYRIRAEDTVAEEEEEIITKEFVLRINSGGGQVISDGNTFAADTYFDTGRTLDRPQTGLEGSSRTFRYSRSRVMGYDIPLDKGDYTVRLHFAELWFGATSGGSGGTGSRIFDVSLEGRLVEDNLDVFSEVGAQTLLVKEHKVTVSDGQLNIDFSSMASDGGVRHPIINAIEILGATTSENEDPVAVATADVLSGSPSLTVQFSGSSSSDDTGIASYSWDFGDEEGSSTEVDPNYTFTEAGDYQVQLTVTDEGGLTNSDTLTIAVVAELAAVVDGLVGHWPLDETNGASAEDVSGQNRTGRLENGLTFDNDKTNGHIEGALIFDGSDDRINLTDIDNSLQSGFSVSAWVIPTNVEGGYQGIVGSSTAGGFMMFTHRGKLAFKVTTNENGQKLISKGNIQNNVWQMISCTFDGSDMHWYINGEHVHSESLSGTLKNSKVAWIGWSGWGEEYFEGGIDDVRLFESALSEQQIFSLFEEGNNNASLLSKTLKTNLSIAESAQIRYVAPNPTTDRFRIIGLSTGTKEIVVTNLLGGAISTLKTKNKEPELDLTGYPEGLYIVRVLQNGSAQTLKVVKE